VLDREGQYEEAMKACLAAKALQRPRAEKTPNGQKQLLNSFKVMEARLSAPMLRGWLENAPALSPARPMACSRAMRAPAQPCWNKYWTGIRTSFRRRKPPLSYGCLLAFAAEFAAGG